MTQWTKTGSNLNLSHKLCMHEVALIEESSCLSGLVICDKLVIKS